MRNGIIDQLQLFRSRPSTRRHLSPGQVQAMARHRIKAPGMTPKDTKDLNAGAQRVFALLSDLRWHSAAEIRLAAGTDGQEASEGLRRMREIRKLPDFDIERELADTGSRLYRYRLVEL